MREQMLEIYSSLLDYFGPQRWWPAETPVEVIIGAILTQNTSWSNVSQAIKNLKESNLLSINGLRHSPNSEIEALIRPTGYFRQKTKKLKHFIDFLYDKHGGELQSLFDLNVAEMREQLLNITGIGPETADSIILYAAGKPSFVIDKYTTRIFSNLGLLHENVKYHEAKLFFEENLPEDVRLYNEFHAMIVALGNQICKKKNPSCSKCPVRYHCLNTQ